MTMDLLTTEEVRTFYDSLLTKPGYIKVLRESISALKIEQILNYAEKVKSVSSHQLDNYGEDESSIFRCNIINLNLKKKEGFEFPSLPLDLLNTDQFSGPSHTKRLYYWFESSMRVIDILTGVSPSERNDSATPKTTDPPQRERSEIPPRLYAYFHRFGEIHGDFKVFMPGRKKENVKDAAALYKGIDGLQFYNEYMKSRKNQQKAAELINCIRRLRGEDREKMKAIAEKYGNKSMQQAWNTTFSADGMAYSM